MRRPTSAEVVAEQSDVFCVWFALLAIEPCLTDSDAVNHQAIAVSHYIKFRGKKCIGTSVTFQTINRKFK